MSDTLTEVAPAQLSHGDSERLSHYVLAKDSMEGYVYGAAITALCGKVWVPSRDPLKFPVCPECKTIYDGKHE